MEVISSHSSAKLRIGARDSVPTGITPQAITASRKRRSGPTAGNSTIAMPENITASSAICTARRRRTGNRASSFSGLPSSSRLVMP